jgi:hypothetical protein
MHVSKTRSARQFIAVNIAITVAAAMFGAPPRQDVMALKA